MRAERVDINWTPELSIYASPSFLKAVSDDYGWLGGFNDSNRLRCILPYTFVRKATVRMVRFRVETIPWGESFELEEEKCFLKSAISFFRSAGADIVIPATTNTIFRIFPDGAIAAPYGTLILDLTKPEDYLWANVHSKHRNVIRNAIHKDVKILDGMEHMDVVYKLIKNTFERSAIPFMKFDALRRMLQGLGQYVKVLIADYQGIAQGCAIFPFSKFSAYYVYGGSIQNPLTGATNLLQWEAIRYFRGLGVKRYDFCGNRINPETGSKQAKLIMFKERFGPQLSQGYLWKYHLNPVKSMIYSLSIRLLRGGDIVDAEHHKLRTPEQSGFLL